MVITCITPLWMEQWGQSVLLHGPGGVGRRGLKGRWQHLHRTLSFPVAEFLSHFLIKFTVLAHFLEPQLPLHLQVALWQNLLQHSSSNPKMFCFFFFSSRVDSDFLTTRCKYCHAQHTLLLETTANTHGGVLFAWQWYQQKRLQSLYRFLTPFWMRRKILKFSRDLRHIWDDLSLAHTLMTVLRAKGIR